VQSRKSRSTRLACSHGIAGNPPAFKEVGTRKSFDALTILDDLSDYLEITDAEIALLEANCLDIVSAILDQTEES
jgi:hypothetical protein